MEKILPGIEQKRDIKILYACETGSRAWGFPSPDSDYDVRFIYMHRRDWYLSLGQQKDTIEYMDGDLDITGWDLRKCLTLLKKSNAPLIERFHSPIEYYAIPGFKNGFMALIETYYSPTAVFYHHYSLAKKFREVIKDRNEVKLKSCFYLIRSLLSCNWIIKDKSLLPMHMEGLMALIDDDYKNRFRELIRLKAGVGEKYLHPKDEALNEYIKQLWDLIEASKENLDVSNADFSLLNNYFLKTVNEHADNRTS